jgi:hypothetical protein
MNRLHTLCAAGLVAGGAFLSAQQTPILPSEPPRGFGASITGAYEGWFDNPDGSHTFLVGYLNRNRAQEVDVPIGPNNRIEPGGPDLGQPTHFLPGRHVGMFTVTVPKSFTPDQRLTWTITVNGQTTSIPLRLHTDYNVSPFRIAHGAPGANADNVPPTIRFEEKGAPLQGPIAMVAKPALTRTTSVATPLALTVWAEDDARFGSGSNAPMRNPPPPVTLLWSHYRGAGKVTFDKARPDAETLLGGNVGQPFRGRFASSARFSAPGEYLLHMTANDYSGDGGGGEVCCWTTAIVKVTVTP